MLQKMILVIGAMFFLFLSGNVVGDTSVLMNLKSGGLVLGGTLLSAFLAFPLKTIKEMLKSLPTVFRNEETDNQGLVKEMEDLARVARMEGTKALEAAGKTVENDFLCKGIELVVDNYDRYEIRNIMEKEYELHFSRKESQVNILNTLAKLAPVFGFVGTIIGLINVLGNMTEPTQIGKGMALALLTTFYGLLFAYFLFLPLAKKVSEHTKAEATLLNVILEGLMGIAEQKNAKSISHRLQSYLGVERAGSSVRTRIPPKTDSTVMRLPLQKISRR